MNHILNKTYTSGAKFIKFHQIKQNDKKSPFRHVQIVARREYFMIQWRLLFKFHE